MANTRSNRGAARFLRCSFVHYKKFAKTYTDEETGLSLWEVHKNQSGTGIPKFLPNKGKEAPLKDLIEGKLAVESFEPAKIKQRLIFEGYLKEECSKCGFHEERLTDKKIPLVLQFKDKNRKNYELDNIELLCYNCSFLFATSPITDRQVQAMEDYVEKQASEPDFEIDDYMKDHLKELGLWQEELKPGQEYISPNYQKKLED
jgi:5-methylcytosine-specific restriction endonuclease McrA